MRPQRSQTARNLITFCCLAFWVLMTYAQESQLHGYIVEALGDTTRGWVRLRSQNRMHKKVSFLPQNTETWLTYTPDQLLGYGVDSRYPYETYEVILPDSTVQARFLRKVFSGDLDLFSFNRRLFIRTIQDSFEELDLEEKESISSSGSAYKRPSTVLTNLLFDQLRPCPSLLQELQSQPPAKYSEEVILDLFKRLYECIGKPYSIYGQDIPLTKVQLSFALKNSLFQWDYFQPNAEITPITGAAFPWKYALNPGLGLRIYSPRKNPFFGMQLNLWYNQFRPVGTFSDESRPFVITNYEIAIVRRALQFDGGFFKAFFIGNQPISWQTGVFVNIYLQSDRTRRTFEYYPVPDLEIARTHTLNRESFADAGFYTAFASSILSIGRHKLWLELRLAANRGVLVDYQYRLFEGSLIARYAF